MGESRSPRGADRVSKSRRYRSTSANSDSERRRRHRRRDDDSPRRDRDDRRDRSRERRRERDRERGSRRDRDHDREDRDDRRGERRHRSRSPESSHRRREYDSKPRRRDSKSPSGNRDKQLEVRKSDANVGRRRDGPLPSQDAAFTIEQGGEVPPEKEKPNFAPTGLLAAATNTVHQADGSAIVLKYHEPPEARKPSAKDEWKLYVFKGSDIVETIDLSKRSCWLIGRELYVVDLPAEHPSISKQHAVIQFRYVEKTNEYGDKLGKVKPYLIDLDSANGTKLNNDPVPGSRYLELRDKDMIQFGHSTREYVLMLAPRS